MVARMALGRAPRPEGRRPVMSQQKDRASVPGERHVGKPLGGLPQKPRLPPLWAAGEDQLVTCVRLRPVPTPKESVPLVQGFALPPRGSHCIPPDSSVSLS